MQHSSGYAFKYYFHIRHRLAFEMILTLKCPILRLDLGLYYVSVLFALHFIVLLNRVLRGDFE